MVLDKEAGEITVNWVMANVKSFYTPRYFLIVTALHAKGGWWYVFGAAAGAAGLGLLFIKKKDAVYKINLETWKNRLEISLLV